MSEDELKSEQKNDSTHGVTLEMMVTRLYEAYGWEKLGENIRINCFKRDPSVQSSLRFLRKTPWAREKVEGYYFYSVRKKIIKL